MSLQSPKMATLQGHRIKDKLLICINICYRDVCKASAKGKFEEVLKIKRSTPLGKKKITDNIVLAVLKQSRPLISWLPTVVYIFITQSGPQA